EASTKTPGFLAELNNQACEALGDYGKSLGFVFQYADDLLDYTGNQEAIGKAVASDLRNGKVTLPLLCALENEATMHKQELHDKVKKCLIAGECTNQEMLLITDLVRTRGGIDSALALGQQQVETAQTALQRAETLITNKQNADKNLDILMALPKALLTRSA
ncbi:MAG: hypothetical protein RJB13_1698, partial [Pseudomonadota bacterium]